MNIEAHVLRTCRACLLQIITCHGFSKQLYKVEYSASYLSNYSLNVWRLGDQRRALRGRLYTGVGLFHYVGKYILGYR